MGLRIAHNIAAINTHRWLNVSDTGLSKSLERLSSGYRINRAADDATGLAQSQSMRANIAGLKVASRNTSEANSLLQVAEGGSDQIANMMTRLKELATQAASANASGYLTTINAEADEVLQEINRIANGTAYGEVDLIDGTYGVTMSATGTALTGTNGFNALSGMKQGYTYLINVHDTAGTDSRIIITAVDSGSNTVGVEEVWGWSAPVSGTKDIAFNALGVTLTIEDDISTAISGQTLAGSSVSATVTGSSTFQVGAANNANNRLTISLDSMLTTDLGIDGLDLTTATNAQGALSSIDAAINTLSSYRANIGAYQNRLSFASANLATTIENTQASESVIRDVDMAWEMAEFTKNQILLQAGTAMLAQANLAPQQVLALFG